MLIIKKNIPLAVVLTITLIVGGVMMFNVISATAAMKKSTDAVADLREKINVLNEKTPAPLQENLDRIRNDHEMIRGKVEELLPAFGMPYIKPLEVFAKRLDETPQGLRQQWAETYSREIGRGGTRNLIFMNFLSTFDSEKLRDALSAFSKEVMANSREVVNEATIHGCLMEALGLPRRMDEMSCRLFIQNMQTSVVAYLRDTQEGQTAFTFHDAKTEKLSFERYDSAMPMPAEVPFIFKHWRMVDDLCMRMKRSGITYFESLARENLIQGSALYRDYIVFDYTLKVRGSLEAIRGLLNSMMDAHRDNKVYIITSISLTSRDEAAAIIGTGTSAASSAAAPVRRPPKLPPGRDAAPEEADAAAPSDFGVVIIGVNDNINAEIKFEYVLHVGNEIKE